MENLIPILCFVLAKFIYLCFGCFSSYLCYKYCSKMKIDVIMCGALWPATIWIGLAGLFFWHLPKKFSGD